MTTQNLVTEICPTTTQGWVKNGAIVVDVREKDEVAQLAFNAPNILHIPLSEFEDRFTEIPTNKEVVVVCQVGVRSLRAAGFLINHGYNPERVVNMKFGMERWVQKGFATIGDTTSVSAGGGSCCSPSPKPASASSSCCAPAKEASSVSTNGSCCAPTEKTASSTCC